MGQTQGYVTQDSPNVDAVIHIPANSFYDTVNGAAIVPGFESVTSSPASGTMVGWHSTVVAATDQETFAIQCAIPEMWSRFGMFANPNEQQQQYGTASAEPGPSSTTPSISLFALSPFPQANNTSSPLAQTGYPPVPGFPIVPTVGPVVKGMAPVELVVNYAVTVAELTAANVSVYSSMSGLVKTFTGGVVAVSHGQIILSGLDTAYAAISNSGTKFLDPCDVLYIVISGTKGATSVLTIYDMFLNVAYNLN